MKDKSIESLHTFVVSGQKAESDIGIILFPFKFYKFVEKANPPKQKCKLCKTEVADVWSSMVVHLEQRHQIECPKKELA